MLSNLLTLQPMKALFAAGLVFLAARAGAATPAMVKRGNLEIRSR